MADFMYGGSIQNPGLMCDHTIKNLVSQPGTNLWTVLQINL